MSQAVNLGVALGAHRTGLAVGYRIDLISNVPYQAFTIAHVAESTTPGTYTVTQPVIIPDEGATVTWGTAGVDMLTTILDPGSGITVVSESSSTGKTVLAGPYIRIKG